MNLGMLGLLGGIGQGISQAGAAWGAGMNEQAKEERSLIHDQKKMQFLSDYEDAKRRRIAGEVTLEANQIAQTRAEGLVAAKRKAYAEDGTVTQPTEDDYAGLLTSAAVPTNRDMVQASVNKGVTPAVELLKIDKMDAQERATIANTAARERETDRRYEADKSDREVAVRKADISEKNADTRARALEKTINRESGDKKPAEIVATEWLIAHKDDPEALKVWEKVHTVKDKSVVTLAADMVAKNPMLDVKKAYAQAADLIRMGGEAPPTDKTTNRANQFKVIR